MFEVFNFRKIFFGKRKIEILIESNFWLWMYVPYIFYWLRENVARAKKK